MQTITPPTVSPRSSPTTIRPSSRIKSTATTTKHGKALDIHIQTITRKLIPSTLETRSNDALLFDRLQEADGIIDQLKNPQPRNRTQRVVEVTRNAIRFIEKSNDLFEQ